MDEALFLGLGALAALFLFRGGGGGGGDALAVQPSLPPAGWTVRDHRDGAAGGGGGSTIASVTQIGARIGGTLAGVPVVGQLASLQASISPTSLIGGVVLGPVGTAAGAVKDLGGKAVGAVKDLWNDIF